MLVFTCPCFTLPLNPISAKIVGIAEHDVAAYDPNGLNIEAIFKHRSEKGTFRGFANAEIIGNAIEVMERECDILIPAALERQIGLKNVKNIKAKIIGEAANGPYVLACCFLAYPWMRFFFFLRCMLIFLERSKSM